MASFAVFNYQFGKYIRHDGESYLFPEHRYGMTAEESFPQRQEIFNTIIDEDFRKERKIVFTSKYSGDKEYIHRYVIPPTDGITIIRVANKRVTTIVTEDLKEVQADDYPNCNGHSMAYFRDMAF